MKLDLLKIIETYELKPTEVAVRLFPNNKHAFYAMQRILDGKTSLNSDQLITLAFMAGVPVGALFPAPTWQLRSGASEVVTLYSKGLTVEIDTATRKWKAFNSSYLKARGAYDEDTTLTDLINNLNTILENGNQDQN